MLKENSKIKIRSNSMWRFKSDHHNADLDLLNCLDSINMCCIQRNNLFVQYQDLNEKPLIWYWQWLWHKWPLGLHLKWKISNFFTQNILSFQICGWCHIQNWTNVSRYVNRAFPAKRDISSSFGEMLCAIHISSDLFGMICLCKMTSFICEIDFIGCFKHIRRSTTWMASYGQ